jgi:hypothetical protein
MYASGSSTPPSVDKLFVSQLPFPAGDHYCVSAVPATYALTDDVIVRDLGGNPFLLSHDSTTLLPLDPEEVNSLGMFYEPAQDSSWHTVTELRRIIFGIHDTMLSEAS